MSIWPVVPGKDLEGKGPGKDLEGKGPGKDLEGKGLVMELVRLYISYHHRCDIYSD